VSASQASCSSSQGFGVCGSPLDLRDDVTVELERNERSALRPDGFLRLLLASELSATRCFEGGWRATMILKRFGRWI
tara:strand:+ start:724 stop:954 length:231 start_codon:yes stop_codon:yes gene_type:complete